MTKEKKLGIFGIILLLVSVCCAPNLTANTTILSGEHHCSELSSQDREITTKTTVTIQVTEQQTKDIRVIFDDLKNQLSTAHSTEETQRIFSDTIITLDRHNLLPKEMSVQQIQQLVNHAYTHQHKSTILQKLFYEFQTETAAGSIQNSFCSIAGNTSNTHVAKLAKRTALQLYYIIDFNTGNVLLNKAALALFVVFNEIAKLNQKLLEKNGPHLGVSLYFGNYHYAPYPDWLSPAQGWISTDGVNGQQNITGSFWGQTMTGGWQPQVDWYMNYTWRGCLGFTGLIYYTGTDNAYFLGSALSVNIGPNRP
jgi:hypothetical protein